MQNFKPYKKKSPELDVSGLKNVLTKHFSILNWVLLQSKSIRSPKVLKVICGTKQECPEIHKNIHNILAMFLKEKFDKVVPCGNDGYYIYLKPKSKTV